MHRNIYCNRIEYFYFFTFSERCMFIHFKNNRQCFTGYCKCNLRFAKYLERRKFQVLIRLEDALHLWFKGNVTCNRLFQRHSFRCSANRYRKLGFNQTTMHQFCGLFITFKPSHSYFTKKNKILAALVFYFWLNHSRCS